MRASDRTRHSGVMNDALRYLLWHSARNRLRGQIARLKRPRYLLAILAGGTVLRHAPLQFANAEPARGLHVERRSGS